MTKSKTPYWGSLIIQLRQKKAWTQEQLAEILKTDQATVSRWEHGVTEPRNEVRIRLECLAKEANLSRLEDALTFVRSSPFPMILVNKTNVIVAASASSKFQEGKSCEEQAPEEEQSCLRDFKDHLAASGFWQMQVARIDYEFVGEDEPRRAVVTPLSLWGETYALVQKAW